MSINNNSPENKFVSLNDESVLEVHIDEIRYGLMKSGDNKSRLLKYLGGRVALRRLLQLLSVENHSIQQAIISTELGAPLLPQSISGSLSHKDNLIVGIAKKYTFDNSLNNNGIDCSSNNWVGIDIEHITNKIADRLYDRILTANEQEAIQSLSLVNSNNNNNNYNPIPLDQLVLLSFSFKEAVFKALNPYLKRFIGFQEVEIFPRVDGSASILFRLNSPEKFEGKGEWLQYNGMYWITAVEVRLLE
eukprot:gene10481-14084_t